MFVRVIVIIMIISYRSVRKKKTFRMRAFFSGDEEALEQEIIFCHVTIRAHETVIISENLLDYQTSHYFIINFCRSTTPQVLSTLTNL